MHLVQPKDSTARRRRKVSSQLTTITGNLVAKSISKSSLVKTTHVQISLTGLIDLNLERAVPENVSELRERKGAKSRPRLV